MHNKRTRPSHLTLAVRAYLAELGRRGGSRRTPAKAMAARLNGKRGGRPSKLARMLAVNGGVK